MKNSVAFVVTMVLTWLLLISIGLGVTPAAGQWFEWPILNPRTYRDTAGRYALTVDPSDRHGRGEATYRFEENGQERWSATLPFTLWAAGISANGTVAGYVYTEGQFAPGNPGEFVVVILDRDGKVRLKDAHQREQSRQIHGPTIPIADDLIVDEPNDRLVLRMRDPDLTRMESWWIYQLSTATAIDKLVPANSMPNAETARNVPGT